MKVGTDSHSVQVLSQWEDFTDLINGSGKGHGSSNSTNKNSHATKVSIDGKSTSIASVVAVAR